MAEAAPFLGIISFGLTVCKDLYAYYHAYKGFDASINSAFESIADVASTLVLLKDSCQDPRLDQERRDRVAACVYQCEDGLKKLSEKLQQLRAKDPEGFRQKSKALFKRSAFPFRKESLDGLRSSAIEVQRRLAFAVQVLDLAENFKSQRVLDCLESWSRGVTITVDQISYDTSELLSIARSDEIDKIKNWLSPPDPWTNHYAARRFHEPGTGKWVLHNNVYKSWICGASRHLWLYGKAGCGKTILSSTIVLNVQYHCRQAFNFGCALFYFSFSDKQKQSYEALLRSLVAQFGTQEPGLTVLRGKYNQRHTDQGGLSVESLESMLLAVLALHDTALVVLDALDECPEESNTRSELFDGLEFLSKQAVNLKILMTSRDVPDIRDCMAHLPAERLPVMASAVDDDIYIYVAQQLSKPPYFTRLKPKSLDLIQNRITAKADGMFRWVYCQLLELSQSKLTKPSHVENLVEALPTTLDGTYTRMLERIGRLGPAVRGDALTLLRWLAYAVRPVTLAELQTALTIRPEDDEVDLEDEGDFRDSLDILSGLVVISDDADSIEGCACSECDKARVETNYLTSATRIRLAHFSVKEYLESTRISESSASFFRLEAGVCHRFLSQSCLTYLMCYSESDEKMSTTQDLYTFHLLDYAAKYWYKHSRLQSGDDVGREVALLTCDKAKVDWLRFDRRFFDHDVYWTSAISCAVYASLGRVVEKLLEAGEDVNTIGPRLEPLLVIATRHEDQTMVELLLAHGADVNMAATTGDCGHALWYATFQRSPLVKVLVDNGADVNYVCESGTALSTACERGDQRAVKTLLERGAQIDTADNMRHTALVEASRCGRKEIVKLLIAKGANVNQPSLETTPLRAAACWLHTDILAMLIDAGAEVNADDSGALSDALLHGNEHAAALLEAKGAKKPPEEKLNETLIEVCNTAYHRRPERAVELLLHRGADVNAEGGALLGALRCGFEDTVALLEAKGAKKLTSDQLNAALIEVCVDEHHRRPKRTAELLLDRGADPDGEDSSALLVALKSGNEDMVALLEARGAHNPTLEQLNDALVQVRKHYYRSNSNNAVQMLLDRGADANVANFESSSDSETSSIA